MNKPSFGGVPSDFDYRDEYAALAAAPIKSGDQLPEIYETWIGPVMSQNKIPACVSHSVVDVMKAYWRAKTGEQIDFSPRFLDILSAEPDLALSDGRRPRTVLKVAATLGCCTTATLPNDTTLPIDDYRDPASISDAARTEAARYKIPGYIRILASPEATRSAIYAHGPITTLFTIGEELWRPSYADKDIDPMRTPRVIVSGHQMTPYGWQEPELVDLQNEWGVAWANDGRNRYSPSAWAGNIIEQWAIATIPADVARFLHFLPSRANFNYRFMRDLQRGDVGEDVKWVQVALMILGLLQPVPAEQLGVYGPKTAEAVGLFQRSTGVVGVFPSRVGPQTRARLNAAFWRY